MPKSRNYLNLVCIILFLVCLVGLLILIPIKIANAKNSKPQDIGPTPTQESPVSSNSEPGSSEEPSSEDLEPAFSPLLKSTADAGQSYLDSLYFLGESTTAHISARGGIDKSRVWSGDGNTLTLSLLIDQTPIILKDDNGQKDCTIGEAVAEKKPEYLVVTLGLNGIMGFINNKELFRSSYKKLIKTVKDNSPDTVIILQSEFPVGDNCVIFSVSAEEVNRYILTINGWTLELATEESVYYLNTHENLVDSNGFLTAAYNSGDGLHITTEGYSVITDYIRHHACISQ